MIRFFILVGAFFPVLSFGVQETASRPDLALGSMLASLLLVIVCIFVFAYLMKKTNLLKNGQGKSAIKVVATQPLTSKGRVQMIEINGQHYLLGVTEQNITLLDKFEKPVTTENEPDNEAVVNPFAVLLSKISNKNHE
ncbi:flagellar biosynthetic protein FliO [Psychromonas ossibalaenae]|uniref:flagellar biosynthetic protein FliO n=1 Tax=Psychromonas ossibalaenae TaxID=444922 RepID=UPI00037C728B|nr:flagellar biosynthetic protein FliO [Psychromonas ossibalaenae]